MHEGHADAAEVLGIADARQLQDVRRADRARREDHFARCIGPLDYPVSRHHLADQLALRGYRMAAILLTGAGFSFNWGGKLAKELNTAIMMKVQDDPLLADLLRRNPNFEEALTELQNAAATSARADAGERLRRLETVIVDVFAVMNKNLAATPFSFCEEI